MLRLTIALALASAVAAQTHPTAATAPQTGRWHAWLDSPGGPIPFGLSLVRDARGFVAAIHNGVERIGIPRVALDPESGSIEFGMDHYDSTIRARIADAGRRLDGEWRRRRGPDEWTVMPFHGTAGAGPRFPALSPAADPRAPSIDGRWSVQFSSDEYPAVGVFETGANGLAQGTFLTALGDYRYLAGSYDDRVLRLSCFDGAHAFLFRARLGDDGVLRGDFWSRDTWHENWTARRDAAATLRDPFTLTKWTGQVSFIHLSYPDTEGVQRKLNAPEFQGKARILVLFGSWCPNCKDATRYYGELLERYSDRGLEVLGLAFELTGDFARDARQVKRYAAHQGIDYPILIAGVANKQKASDAFPVIDRVRSYPTTIFMRRDGTVHTVHTGFSGPATGAAHDALRARFESIVEELLDAR